MRLNATSPVVSRYEQLAARDKLAAATESGRGSGAAAPETSATSAASKKSVASTELSVEQKQQVAELQRIDANVRAHEQAHIAAGGSVITSGASFSYTYGPDGKQYAVAGEVGIDTTPVQQPNGNIEKGQLIQRAALAPADPSPQDFRVAAVGGQLVQQGYAEIASDQSQTRPAESSKISSSTPSDTADFAATQTQSAEEITKAILARAYSATSGAERSGGLSVFA